MKSPYIDIHSTLIARCQNGDGKAQQEVYKLYCKSMYNIAYRMVGHVGEAEDILQETFIEAFTNIKRFRAESSFGAWIKKIVVNRSINYLKKKKPVLIEEIDENAAIVYEQEDQNIQYTIAQIHQAINKLSEGYRVVLSLYLLEGYDHAEIAQVLNITESTSKSQYNRAKAKVREIIKNQNYGR